MKITDLISKLNDDQKLQANFDEYLTPLSQSMALHLLRRISFHPTLEQLNTIVGKTASEAFDIITGTGNPTLPKPTSNMENWINLLEENPLDGLPQDVRGEIESRLKTRYSEFITWWLTLMSTENYPSMEKFTLFLHTIWCIEFTYDTLSLMPPPLLYRNNQSLRSLGLADYKSIAEAMSQDGAMIMYQSLFYSAKGTPNENYMRELMELFTMGIGDLSSGDTNYTEGDIREGARALTGWRTVAYLGQQGAPANRPFETFFAKSLHDTEGKKIMQYGQISPITDDENTEELVRTKEVKGLINILFTERGKTIARFICDKIIRFYVYSDPSSSKLDTINTLADFMYDNNFDLKKVYKKIFTSKYFFSEEFIGCQIKTPTEFIIGLEKMFGVSFNKLSNGYTRNAVFSLEQVLYDPPNVGSWKAYRSWISTTTYPLRIKYAKEIITLLTDSQIVSFVAKFNKTNSLALTLDNLLEYLLPRQVDNIRKNKYKEVLLNGISESTWIGYLSSGDVKIAVGIRNFLNTIILSPDFQLS